MNAKTITLLFSFLITSFGCQTGSYYGTEEAFAPEPAFEKVLVAEASTAISRSFAPGKTTFYFPHKTEKFAADLEAKLRRSGYAFVNERPADKAAKEVTEIGYKLDSVGSDQSLIVLRVVAGDGWQLSRVYKRQKDGSIQASGPLLIRKG